MKKQKEVMVADYSQVIEQIHNEFDSASDLLLEQAKKIISKEGVAEKALRLQKAGFGKTKEVKENGHLMKIKTLAEQTNKIVAYYQQKYPLYKFITEQQVMVIAEKYNLVLGDVSDFIGFVPEKNLREVERFKIDEADKLNSNLASANKMKIVAPVKDFDMQGKIVRDRKIEIPDPVVLQPVKYGFLIVTAWGDEASDPLVVNNINN